MASFTAQDVKALRERTGCGMMDCKKALQSADGDMDKAMEYLREKGIAAVAKKAGRIAAEGLVYAEVIDKVGVIIEVNAETDFVAKNDQFKAFVKECADTIAANNPADVDALLSMKAKNSDMTIADLLREKVLTIGENIKIRRFARMEGDLITYIHGDGRIGVLVKFDTDVASKDGFEEYAKNIAMQIAAINPPYLDRDSVPADVLEEEKKILTAQAINEGKPQNIAEKIVAGRLNKFYKEMCLVEQDYVKDSELTVAKYTDKVAKELGGTIKIVQFVRFEKGEGIQKREDNFAEEIANMVK
ncbi:Elongation factor Ts [[Clostridium] cellulosi]|jgi:translation elongation factor Ts (EF-Ts)|uniref:Elongation factor Ts n=1 Tax=[Clostridium] cellulosi TaxID=29343 RepID=A0A078KUI0_9FIRM|nr:Elongation factor Ts [[Clostridium] cellulosi]